ncbi:MAG: hypothetical protein HY527_19455 [Betaproteobacteria bacterium]|nr:hypothetical protein [Betaproteobacteria bacterium]
MAKKHSRSRASRPVTRDAERQHDPQGEQVIDTAIRAAQNRNREKANAALRVLFRDRPELLTRFGVERPKKGGRPPGTRETPSKVARRVYVARSFGMKKSTILTALGYTTGSAAYRLIDRAVAQVDADEKSTTPTFNVKGALATYEGLSEPDRTERLIAELGLDGLNLRLRTKWQRPPSFRSIDGALQEVPRSRRSRITRRRLLLLLLRRRRRRSS